MSAETARHERAAHRELGDNAEHVRRNYLLGVLAGMFAGTSRNFINPELILVGLIYTLTRSPLLAGLIPLITKAGALAPQLLISSSIEHSPRRRPYFVLLTVTRSLALVGLVACMWLLTRSTGTWSLIGFYAAYLVVCICNGAGMVIFSDMAGRLIPRTRVGSFLGARTLLGGGLAIVAGVVVIQPILSGVEVPLNYLYLGIIGTVLAVVDMSTWCMCREEPGPSKDDPTTLGRALSLGMHWLRNDHNYRCYFWVRLAFRISYLGLAFFIPYGSEQLSTAARAGGIAMLGGIMVATLKGSMVLGGALWGKVADTHGSRTALAGSAMLLLLAPVLALLAPQLPPAFSVHLTAVRPALDLPMCVYLIALACMGCGLKGNGLAGLRFVITAAPKKDRPSYVAFLNTITSPLTLLPLAGAWIANQAGMNTLMLLVVVGGILATLGSLRMNPVTQTAE
jgi:hypothetical protein